MGLSIHEHLGEASVRHHLDRVEYPAKRLFSGTGATSLNYYYTHPIQTPEHLFYGMNPASIPGRGAAQLQSLVQGGGANGVGISFPPPRPGSMCLVAEPGRGRLVSLGQLRAHGAEGEIGLDQTDRLGNYVRSSSHLAIPVSYDSNGLSIVTSIPRPGLDNPLSGSPLFTELPANVQFTSFSNATTYDLNIGSSHRLSRSEPRASIGTASNGTAAFESQINQFITASEYEDFLSGTSGTFFFTDPTQQVPTTYPAITVDPAEQNNQSALAEAKAKEEAYLNQLDQLLRLPINQDLFRSLTYEQLHSLSTATWQSSDDLKVDLNEPGFLDKVTNTLQQINEYLPAALGVVNLVKGLGGGGGEAATIETESYAVDPQTLTLTPTLRAELKLINKYLTGDNLLTYNYQTKVLTLAGRQFYVERRPQLDPAYIQKLQTLNKYLPKSLKFRIYQRRGAVTSVKVFPGVYIDAEQGLIVPDTIDPVGKSLSRLHCYLPSNVYSVLSPKVSTSPGSAPAITTSLNSRNPAQANSLLQEIIRLVGDLSTDDPVEAGLKQIERYLPADMKGLFTYSNEDGLKFNTEKAISSGLNAINKELPGWLKLDVAFDGNNFKGFNIGPLSLDFSNGVDFSVDLEQVLKLTGVLDLLDSIAELPIDAKELKGLIQSVRYPHDRLSGQAQERDSFGFGSALNQATSKAKNSKVEATFPRSLKDHQKYFPYSNFADDTQATINTGGNLDIRSTPELNIDSSLAGSPSPLLLVSSELLANAQQLLDVIFAKPQTTDTGRSPITGKQYSRGRAKAYCIGEEIPLLDIGSGVVVAEPRTIPTPTGKNSQLVNILAGIGMGPTAAPLIEKLDQLVSKPAVSLRPEQISVTDFLDTLAIATTNPAVQQALTATSISIGSPVEVAVSTVTQQQQRIQPSCGDLAEFSTSVSELDGSQQSLSGLLNALNVPDMLLSSVLHSQSYLRDWLEQIDSPLVPAMEHLAKGDLFYFLVEVINYRTGTDILQSPQKALRLKQLVHSRYKLAAPGFSLLDELLND